MSSLTYQFFDALLDAELLEVSDELCCQILAWVSVYGGEHEAAVMNPGLNTAIRAAQKKLNILGGEVPDLKLVPVMVEYIRSITDHDNPPSWVPELEKQYGVESYRRKGKQ
ncbi:MAG: hypothetical protein LBC99_01970 [Spirochaetota bacterium]|jgi:hypothetical protein|nr:hypothetical protein [Spirochaetota bacterium]